ncbi:TadE family protein [Allokutzneria albata]|uniref:TadE-like protein n=1 Tax=Allokutzneria albata TaxID=211114 RepID=A0A1G9Y9S1_ALLAB|nr:TadE family protein [Allokutzneria albata]SDN05862.1 TadE-like protein [Allokutzneria albata]
MNTHDTTPNSPQRTDRWGRLRRLLREENGSATVELVIAAPLVMLMVTLAFQIAVWAHATHIARAAATTGLAAARVVDATASHGEAAAQRVLDQLGAGPLRASRVALTRGQREVVVRVSGTATNILPGLRLPVRAEAAGPVQRLTASPGTQP